MNRRQLLTIVAAVVGAQVSRRLLGARQLLPIVAAVEGAQASRRLLGARQLLTIVVAVIVVLTAEAQSHRILTTRYPPSMLEQVLVAPTRFQPVSDAADNYWQTVIPRQMRESYASLGKHYAGQPWLPIPDSIFAQYKTNGNRALYEERYYTLRRRMASLVIAEVMEHQGRFTADIVSGLRYFIGEPWWGVPAHYPLNHPDASRQVVELFSAETAALLAWTVYMLHDDLEPLSPGISEQMRTEIDRRLLTPARTTDYDWKRRTTNWNPWICSNWLACVLLCERDRSRQLEAVGQVLKCLDLFYDNCPDDGSCDEGVLYWDRAAASLYDCLRLLQLATDGHVTMAGERKLQRMAAFAYKTYIGNRLYVNFADALPKTALHPNVALPFGLYAGDSLLAGFAVWRAQADKMFQSPSALFLASGNFPSLSRELLFLSLYDDFKDLPPVEPLLRDVWLADLQVCSARQEVGTTQGLFVAAKGGHNGEAHNHNDVGNFIVYKNATPMIVDIGVGTYTAQTFSNRRYELFNYRSAYHNVPLVNGCEQREGHVYHAADIGYACNDSLATLTLDIAKAYPDEASVDKWVRTVQLRRVLSDSLSSEGRGRGEMSEVRVTEDYQLGRYLQPTDIVLVCCGTPHLVAADSASTDTATLSQQQTANIVITNGNQTCTLSFDDSLLAPSVEPIAVNDANIFHAMPVRDLFRIRLTVRSRSKSGKVSYSIK